MKVILQQDVRGQGKKGQMIDAAEGYARNYLLPRKLAIPATADAPRRRRPAPPPWRPRTSCVTAP